MRCNNCGQETSIGICTKLGLVCEMCSFYMDPPKIDLVSNLSNGYLYNSTQETMETTMTLAGFQSCGWFLRKKVVKGVFAKLSLEYHGKVRCVRCDNYAFPISMKKFCPKYNFCGTSQVQTLPTLRRGSP